MKRAERRMLGYAGATAVGLLILVGLLAPGDRSDLGPTPRPRAQVAPPAAPMAEPAPAPTAARRASSLARPGRSARRRA